MKRVLAVVLSFVMILTMSPIVALADSETVVTIGADLTDAQKETMFKYFGVDKNKVSVIEVTNKEEREYLEGVATEAQIGRRTLSCAYIQQTEEGNGINVKIANLNMVTSAMIATTLSTAGIYNCNVVAACPIEVSGTGALTGIMKAFETVTGEKLDEEKKELATEELITTADLSKELGTDEATGLITKAKEEVIKSGTQDEGKIKEIIKDTAKTYNITLTDKQVQMILDVLLKVAEQKYDYKKLKSTLQGISSKAAKDLNIDIDLKDVDKEDVKGFFGAVSNFFEAVGDFFKSIGNWFVSLFGGSSEDKDKETTEDKSGTEVKEEDKDLGILNNTNESVLGDNVITNSTDENATQTTATPTEEAIDNTGSEVPQPTTHEQGADVTLEPSDGVNN